MAVPRLRAAKFDEQMTLVEHLDELRNRIIFSGAFLVIAIAVWVIWSLTRPGITEP